MNAVPVYKLRISIVTNAMFSVLKIVIEASRIIFVNDHWNSSPVKPRCCGYVALEC